MELPQKRGMLKIAAEIYVFLTKLACQTLKIGFKLPPLSHQRPKIHAYAHGIHCRKTNNFNVTILYI